MERRRTTERLAELDFLRGVLIVLMISFHLVFIEQRYPGVKQVVYAFHMPAFLLVSGYLMNTNKPFGLFLRTMGWFAVPYVIMESGYVAMAALLPINEHIERLTPSVFLEKLLLHPIGPYWYLQTLVVCGLSVYAVEHLKQIKQPTTRLLLLVMSFGLLAKGVKVVSLPFALYFLAGAMMRRQGCSFVASFPTSLFSVGAVALLLVGGAVDWREAESSGAVLLVWLAVGIILWLYGLVGGTIRRVVCFLGSNTLPLFLFSPVFTLLCKPLSTRLAFDPTGLLFLVVALAISICGCLAIAWLMDELRLSPWFCGRRRMVVRNAGARPGRTGGGRAGRGIRSGSG